jgi:hypothetical protein
VRNEIETNETKSTKTKRNETKNLTDPAEYPYDKQYENKLNKVQTRSLLPAVTVDINTCFLCKIRIHYDKQHVQ